MKGLWYSKSVGNEKNIASKNILLVLYQMDENGF